MTDLQTSLIAAGGVFIVGVFTYNKWQEYKAKKSVERAFSSDHDDVLMRDAIWWKSGRKMRGGTALSEPSSSALIESFVELENHSEQRLNTT